MLTCVNFWQIVFFVIIKKHLDIIYDIQVLIDYSYSMIIPLLLLAHFLVLPAIPVKN